MTPKSQISMLPEPKYNPRWPKKATLASKALFLMLGDMKLTHPLFEALSGSWRLAAHIHILKKLGWPVITDQIDFDGEYDEGRQRHMGVYSLPDELIQLMYNP